MNQYRYEYSYEVSIENYYILEPDSCVYRINLKSFDGLG